MLMYPDSLWITKSIIRIYLIITGICILIFRRSFWPVHVPSHLAVRPISDSKKTDYELEHQNYRTLHSMAMQGVELNKWYYFYYREISLKYNWPYIKELYDSLPDPAPLAPGRLPADLRPIDYFATNLIEHIGKIGAYVKGFGFWRLNAGLCVFILAITFVGQNTPNKSRMYDFLSNAAACLILQVVILPFYLAHKRHANRATTAANR